MRVPSYRKKVVKGLEYARVTIKGKEYLLGRYDSPESHERYRQLIAEHLTKAEAGGQLVSARPL